LPMVFAEEEIKAIPGTPEFYTALGICICKLDWNKRIIVCVFFAGLMSGLTVGYLSIDKLDLEIKESIGTEEEKR
jgi:hypothetical protein